MFSVYAFSIIRKATIRFMCKEKVYAIYGEGIEKDWLYQKGFVNVGDFSFEDSLESSRPDEVDSDQIKILLENGQREKVNILRINKSNAGNICTSLFTLVDLICDFNISEKPTGPYFWERFAI